MRDTISHNNLTIFLAKSVGILTFFIAGILLNKMIHLHIPYIFPKLYVQFLESVCTGFDDFLDNRITAHRKDNLSLKVDLIPANNEMIPFVTNK